MLPERPLTAALKSFEGTRLQCTLWCTPKLRQMKMGTHCNEERRLENRIT
jgi:hypothetical protein